MSKHFLIEFNHDEEIGGIYKQVGGKEPRLFSFWFQKHVID